MNIETEIETEIDHAEAKQAARDWDTVATFGSTFADGDGTGACDVEVQTASYGGNWYLRTRDDAGGSDDCDATPYTDKESAEAAAKEYAEEHDECAGLSAATWLAKEAEEQTEAGKSEDGEYVLAHKDGTRWDDDRYSDRTAADAAINAWYARVKKGNPGTDIIWHLMDTPELARINEEGEIEMASAENE